LYSKLFKTTQISTLVIPNRIVMTAMGNHMAKPACDHHHFIPGLKRLADAIHEAGAVVCAQITISAVKVSAP
jgi:2,4-dienoyl-CoA reductase-like NADH-dependent reductase (Old Yellow Enzyme family)